MEGVEFNPAWVSEATPRGKIEWPGFVPPPRGGAFGRERIPRVSPWAIFDGSLREQLRMLCEEAAQRIRFGKKDAHAIALPQSDSETSSTSEAVLPGLTIPYFRSRNSCNSAGNSSASSCQVSTLHLTRI